MTYISSYFEKNVEKPIDIQATIYFIIFKKTKIKK
jgi:hypothetical protein